MRIWRMVLAALVAASLGSMARGAITCDVAIDDRGRKYSDYETKVRACIEAAGAEWGQVLEGSARLNIVVRYDPEVKTVRAASILQPQTRTLGVYKVYEQGALAKLRENTTKANLMPDAEIVLAPEFLAQMWFDPEPGVRTAAVPADRVDAVSVFLQEFGHVFAFKSWRGSDPKESKGLSTFDLHVSEGTEGTSERELFFVGPHALAMYGRPVPLDRERVWHLGKAAAGMGGDLSGELMDGVVGSVGKRFRITPLTLAMLDDIGVGLNAQARAVAESGRGAAAVGVPAATQSAGPTGGAGAGADPAVPAGSQMSLLAVGLNMSGMIVGVLVIGILLGVLIAGRLRQRKARAM